MQLVLNVNNIINYFWSSRIKHMQLVLNINNIINYFLSSRSMHMLLVLNINKIRKDKCTNKISGRNQVHLSLMIFSHLIVDTL